MHGFSVVDAAVASAPAEKEEQLGFSEVGSDVSTVDTDDDTEEINVHAWGSVGRKIFHTLADLSDDEFEVEPPIDVKSWSAVGARIRQSLVDLDEAGPVSYKKELAKKTQRRVEDQSYFPHLNHEQQQHMKDLWKKFRVQCYDYWMEEVENEKLMHAHGVLKEVVARCTLSFRERSSHVKDAAVCHEEILMAYRHCKRLRTE
ncbi:unnamed protein product [Effrenium voratum]|uniref:Uncharacterized protein n=1 Tax=Effrenium voratum TaxID=2562239 RepID=A0AA36NFX5_9DINO|nr:unnamed protein product [Effrenium voratum]